MPRLYLDRSLTKIVERNAIVQLFKCIYMGPFLETIYLIIQAIQRSGRSLFYGGLGTGEDR